MNPWTFYRHSRAPGAEDEFVDIAWEETPSGFEMRVSRGVLNKRETARYTFSTQDQLNRAMMKWKASALYEGFKPFMRDSPKSES
jgi:hypothetical protein